MGGLSKKAYQIEQIAKRNNKPYLIIDAGGLLFKKEYLAPGRQEPEKITASGILEAYTIMDVDAVGIGKQDLAAGLSFLLSQRELHKFKWINANIVRKSDNKPIFTTASIKKVGNISIGITGLMMQPAKSSFRQSDDATVLALEKVLPGMIAKLDKSCDLIILLSSLSPQENKKIASLYDNIHILVQSNPRSSNLQPTSNNNTLILQTGSKGKYLGLLDVNWQVSRKWKQVTSRTLEIKKNELERLNRQINIYKNNQQLIEKKKNLVKQLQLLESEQKKATQSGQNPSTYKNTFISLDTSLPDQREVLKVVQGIKTKINTQGRRSVKKRARQPENYTGWTTCKACHKKQSTVWQKSRHARSYQTLSKKKQQYNINCIGCHVTGVFTGKEAYALSLPHTMRQVGCEACHGPGQKHSKNPQNDKMTTKPPAKICRRCHTPAQDDTFNYRKDIMLLACPSAKH